MIILTCLHCLSMPMLLDGYPFLTLILSHLLCRLLSTSFPPPLTHLTYGIDISVTWAMRRLETLSMAHMRQASLNLPHHTLYPLAVYLVLSASLLRHLTRATPSMP